MKLENILCMMWLKNGKTILSSTLFVLLLSGIALPSGVSASNSKKSVTVDSVTLALKWSHQFQFAGYYAAVRNGYFSDEGLDVTLTTPQNNVFPEESVKNGSAEYGLGISNLVVERIKGNPIVVIASFFQHSPVALISRADKNLRYPSDFVDRTVMGTPGTSQEIRAIFLKEGINPESIHFIPLSRSDAPMIDGSVDGTVKYITDYPLRLKQLGIELRVMRAIDYGIDFYGDVLFTSEKEIKDHPERVRAFRRASVKGWEYAAAHVDEMIEYILTLPGVKENGLTKENLRHEAKQTIELIQPVLVELGHSNPDRWQKIAETYALLGIVPEKFSLEGFIYNPDAPSEKYREIVQVIVFLAVIILFIFVLVLTWNRRLKKMVTTQTAEIVGNREGLKHALERNQALLNANPDLMFLFSREYTIVDYHPKDHPERLFLSPEQFMNHPVDSLFTPELTQKIKNCIDAVFLKHETPLLSYHLENEGGIRYYEARFVPSGEETALSVVRDVTDRRKSDEENRKLTEQLHQSQKMQAIGQLAGGVAHDFNNSLSVILGAADMLRTGVSEQRQKKYVEMISEAGERAADLTKKLLLFSRKGTKGSSAVNCAKIVEDTAGLLTHTINKNISITVENRAVQTSIIGDDPLLQNAFMNIGINASHAMPDGGELTFTLQNLELDAEYCEASPFDIQPGEYLEVSIRDTGCGMSPEIQTRIFEPFFTTKEAGKGTGLGMAAVYGTVLEHNGAITVYSEPGTGTVFHLYLPLTRETMQQEIKSEPAFQGSGTVLVIDDEELIRITSSALLQSLGYKVILAANGREGVERFVENRDEIDLIILDMIMPVMGGRETFGKLREIDREIPIIIASGFAKDEDIAELKRQGVNGFLNKPFRRAELAEKMSTAMLLARSPA